MTVAAILRSRLLKMAAKRKNSYIFVTELKLQVRLSMQSLHRNTLLQTTGIKISTFLKKKKKLGNEAEVVQRPLKMHTLFFETVLIVLRQHTKHANFEGAQVCLFCSKRLISIQF